MDSKIILADQARVRSQEAQAQELSEEAEQLEKLEEAIEVACTIHCGVISEDIEAAISEGKTQTSYTYSERISRHNRTSPQEKEQVDFIIAMADVANERIAESFREVGYQVSVHPSEAADYHDPEGPAEYYETRFSFSW